MQKKTIEKWVIDLENFIIYYREARAKVQPPIGKIININEDNIIVKQYNGQDINYTVNKSGICVTGLGKTETYNFH
jgi:hypothetical protein